MSTPDATIPPAAQALFAQGVRHLGAGDADGAQRSFAQALDIAPGFAEAHANLGWLLHRAGQLEAAEAHLRRAVRLQPQLAQAQLNLGTLLAQLKCLDEAEQAYLAATRARPDDPAAWSNLGALYASTGRDAPAEAALRHALSLSPHHAGAQFNLSYLLLRQGRYEEGWRRFESRDWYAALAQRLPCPRWQGQPLEGRRVLITYEAGHGDMIHFIRYAPLLKARGAAHLTLLCHPALKRLMALMPALDSVIGFDESLPDANWDVWTPLMSLPYHLGTRLGPPPTNLPATLPYLHASDALRAQWRAHLPRDTVLVGLAWKGNPRFENDADRSLPSLSALAPLAQVPGVCFVSLQKGAGEEEALHPPAGMRWHTLHRPLEDFLDTASLIQCLDLVISVDSAAAHLAGALGKPCWVLLPAYMPDWRWLQGRDDSPWYPGVMRLFRQASAGHWGPVVDDVARQLTGFAQAATRPLRNDRAADH
jgi:Flp pilus assembly protein TadD